MQTPSKETLGATGTRLSSRASPLLRRSSNCFSMTLACAGGECSCPYDSEQYMLKMMEQESSTFTSFFVSITCVHCTPCLCPPVWFGVLLVDIRALFVLPLDGSSKNKFSRTRIHSHTHVYYEKKNRGLRGRDTNTKKKECKEGGGTAGSGARAGALCPASLNTGTIRTDGGRGQEQTNSPSREKEDDAPGTRIRLRWG